MCYNLLGDYMNLREELFNNQDLKYRDFHKKLVPNVDESKIIGVRVPIVRKIAKSAFQNNAENLCEYYEEKEVFGLTISMKKCSAEEHKKDISEFVSLIDNWAICDICTASLKFIAKDKAQYFDFLSSFVGAGEYPTRFAIVALMDFYLDDEYIDRVLDLYKTILSEKYYVNMALAWAYSTAFVKYEEKVTGLIKSKTLSPWVQNKTIQKIRESYRVDNKTKHKLKKYKI